MSSLFLFALLCGNSFCTVPSAKAELEWKPASGLVEGYIVTVNGIDTQVVLEPKAIVPCYGMTDTVVAVQAVDAFMNKSIASIDSETFRCTGFDWNPDANGDGMTNGLEFRLMLAAIGGIVIDQDTK